MIQKYFKTTLCGAEKKSTYPQIIRQNEAKMPLPPPPKKKKIIEWLIVWFVKWSVPWRTNESKN